MGAPDDLFRGVFVGAPPPACNTRLGKTLTHALRPPDAQPPERVRLDGALALVVGSEGEGMRALIRKSCDLLVSLPMRGQVDSLNAAVAGSVMLYLALQARLTTGRG
jgi:tRNA G18 (ribose-2'-O)-methylase SpoU